MERGDTLNLSFGEPDFDTPPHIVEAAGAAARAGRTRYTASRGITELREAAAASITRRAGHDVDPDQIVATVGGVQGVFSTLAALADRGDAVLVPDPSWPNYVGICTLLGLEIVRYPLPAANGFEPDLDAARAARDATRREGADHEHPVQPDRRRLAARHGRGDGRHRRPQRALRAVRRGLRRDGVRRRARAVGAVRARQRRDRLQPVEDVRDDRLADRLPGGAGRARRDDLEGARGRGVVPDRTGAVGGGRGAVRPAGLRARDARRLPLAPRPGGRRAAGRGTCSWPSPEARSTSSPTSPPPPRTRSSSRSTWCATTASRARPGDTFGPGGAGLLRISLAAAPETVTEGIRRIGEAVRAAVPA